MKTCKFCDHKYCLKLNGRYCPECGTDFWNGVCGFPKRLSAESLKINNQKFNKMKKILIAIIAIFICINANSQIYWDEILDADSSGYLLGSKYDGVFDTIRLEMREDSLCVVDDGCFFRINGLGVEAYSISYNETSRGFDIFSNTDGQSLVQFIPFDVRRNTTTINNNDLIVFNQDQAYVTEPASFQTSMVRTKNHLDISEVNDSTLRVYIGKFDGFGFQYERHDSIDIVIPQTASNYSIEYNDSNSSIELYSDGVLISSEVINVDDADADPTNELDNTYQTPISPPVPKKGDVWIDPITNIVNKWNGNQWKQINIGDGYEPNTDTQLTESDILAMNFIQNADDGDWTIAGNSIYRLGGYVAIGKSSPTSILNIRNGISSDDNVIRINSTSTNFSNAGGIEVLESSGKLGESNNYGFRLYYDGADNAVKLQTGNQEDVGTAIEIDRNSRNVGIQKSPTAALDINGDIKVSDRSGVGTSIGGYDDSGRSVDLTIGNNITLVDGEISSMNTQLTESEILAMNFIQNADDGDSDPTNELQNLTGIQDSINALYDSLSNSFSGNYYNLDFTNTTGLSDGVDNFEANTDSQQISIIGTELTLENGGTVTIPQDGYEPNTDTQLTESEILAMNFIQNADDGDWTIAGGNLYTEKATVQIKANPASNNVIGNIEFVNKITGNRVAGLRGVSEGGDAGGFSFATNNGSTYSTRLRIDEFGNFGIKTASPTSILTLQNLSNTEGNYIRINNGTNYTHAGGLEMLESGGQFGTSGNYGIRVKYDGSDNKFKIRGCNQANTFDLLTLTRDAGDAVFNGSVTSGDYNNGSAVSVLGVDVNGTQTTTNISSLLGSSPWTVSGNNINRLLGSVGIGTTSSAFKLNIDGSVWIKNGVIISGENSGGSQDMALTRQGAEMGYRYIIPVATVSGNTVTINNETSSVQAQAQFDIPEPTSRVSRATSASVTVTNGVNVQANLGNETHTSGGVSANGVTDRITVTEPGSYRITIEGQYKKTGSGFNDAKVNFMTPTNGGSTSPFTSHWVRSTDEVTFSVTNVISMSANNYVEFDFDASTTTNILLSELVMIVERI